MKKIYINGEHLCLKSMDGMKRYMIEILSRIDRVLPSEQFELILFHHDYEKLEGVSFKNIKDIAISGRGKRYRLINVPRLIKANQGIMCTMSNDLVLVKNSIYTVHDFIPLHKLAGFPFKERLRMKLFYFLSIKNARKVVTGTQTIRDEILRRYRIASDKIALVGSGYEHICQIEEDDSIFERFGELKKGNYYLGIGNQFKYKNYAWIRECAKYNEASHFAIAGSRQPAGENIETGSNVTYLGYVTDNEYKALLINCKAFIHPSRLEGFGIPPLEAIAVGAKAVVANASCLPEVYGDSVYYIDPNDAKVDLDEMINKEDKNDKQILDTYSWEKAAKKWLDIFSEI